MKTNMQRRGQPGQWGWIVLRLIALGAVALALSLGPAPVARAANFTVTNTNDSGAGSLRQAIVDANTTAGADIITFSVSGTITLGSSLFINDDVTIDGSGQSITMSGNNAVLVMWVFGGRTLNLMNLTVANGSGSLGGGIHNEGTLTVSNSTFAGNAATNGGGIANLHLGTLTVSNSTFVGNGASTGGGIYNESALTVSNSTFSGNSANDDGGGIYNESALTVSNSTFSGNSASSLGGGIRDYLGTLTVSNSTFSGNNASFGGGIRSDFGTLTMSNSTFSGNNASSGGGIFINAGPTQFLRNNIIANSLSGGDCVNITPSPTLNNLIEDGTCSPLLSGDPNLGPLANNGGPTQTHALLSGSIAIDAANNAICATVPVNNLDQRGMARPQGPACDIGAYEFVPLQDTTPPAITPNAAGTLGNNGWYVSNVTVSWTLLDNESAITAQSGCTATPITTDTAGTTLTCSATSAGGTSSQSVTINRDATAPAIACGAADGLWHTSDVSIPCTASDGTAGLANAADASFTLVTNVPAGTETANAATDSRSVADAAGNAATAGPIGGNKVDKQAPSISITTPTNTTYTLNQVMAASYTCLDGGSGLASCVGSVPNGSPIDTASVGAKTFTVNAADNAGNAASASVAYTVIYTFRGFFQPVDNLPVLNAVKAGSALPVKFSLAGNQGLTILAAGYPTSQQIACDSAAPIDDIEQTVTVGGSSLAYDAPSDQYVYVWKTDKAWAGTCRQLVVRLADGTDHRANFKFK